MEEISAKDITVNPNPHEIYYPVYHEVIPRVVFQNNWEVRCQNLNGRKLDIFVTLYISMVS